MLSASARRAIGSRPGREPISRPRTKQQIKSSQVESSLPHAQRGQSTSHLTIHLHLHSRRKEAPQASWQRCKQRLALYPRPVCRTAILSSLIPRPFSRAARVLDFPRPPKFWAELHPDVRLSTRFPVRSDQLSSRSLVSSSNSGKTQKLPWQRASAYGHSIVTSRRSQFPRFMAG